MVRDVSLGAFRNLVVNQIQCPFSAFSLCPQDPDPVFTLSWYLHGTNTFLQRQGLPSSSPVSLLSPGLCSP